MCPSGGRPASGGASVSDRFSALSSRAGCSPHLLCDCPPPFLGVPPVSRRSRGSRGEQGSHMHAEPAPEPLSTSSASPVLAAKPFQSLMKGHGDTFPKTAETAADPGISCTRFLLAVLRARGHSRDPPRTSHVQGMCLYLVLHVESRMCSGVRRLLRCCFTGEGNQLLFLGPVGPSLGSGHLPVGGTWPVWSGGGGKAGPTLSAYGKGAGAPATLDTCACTCVYRPEAPTQTHDLAPPADGGTRCFGSSFS